jgi:hypothetical protein
MSNDPILDAIQGGGTGVADQDPILSAIQRGPTSSTSKIGTPDVVANFANKNGISIGAARRQLRSQGYELMSFEDAQARTPSLETSAQGVTVSADPILAAIKGQGSDLRTPTLDELTTGTSPETETPSLTDRASRIGRSAIPLGPRKNFAVDATQIPRNPFTNELEFQPPMATEEEKQRSGTVGRGPGAPGVTNPVGSTILPGLNSNATLQGNEPIINPERGLIAPQNAMTETEQRQHPVLTAVGQLTEGLTSPANLAILAGTEGFGELPAAVKVGLSTYFTAQMANGVKDYSTQGWQAYKRGDNAEAKRLWTLALGSAAMGAVTGAHAVREMGLAPEVGPEPIVPRGKISGPIAIDEATTRGARRMQDFEANDAARQGMSNLAEAESGIEAGKRARINAPVNIPALPETTERPPILQGRAQGPEPNPLSTEAAEVREQQAEREAKNPPPFRVLDKRRIGAGGEQLQPETPETLQGQVDALAAGTNKVVYFPKGQESIPEPPDNATVTVVKGNKAGAGTYYHTDDVTPQQIRAAVKDGSYAQLLGYTQSKEQAAAAGKPAGVVARDANGTELKAGLVDSSDAQAIAKQAAEFGRQFPDAQVSVETPEHVIRRRQGPATKPGMVIPPESSRTSASPEAPPGDRWTGDRGAMPGEPAWFLDGETADKAKAAITEIEDPRDPGRHTFEAHLPSGELIGKFGTIKEAAKHAEEAAEPKDHILDAIRGTVPGPKSLRQKQQPLAERFSAQTLEEARQELGAAHELASSFERPGRYFSQYGDQHAYMPSRSTNAAKGIHASGTWYGVGSTRHIVAEQFPWYGEIEQGAGKIGKLIEKGKGAEYERLLGKVAESIQREKESAAPVMAEFAPRLRELSDKIDGNDQELSDSLEQLASADGRGFKNLREYVQGKVENAERANSFFAAIDDAAEEAREASSEETPEHGGELRAGEGGRASANAARAAGEEHSESENHEPAETARNSQRTESLEQNALPGFESAIEEQNAGAERVRGEQLTAEANRPLGDIESAAGEMERNSPLFRGKGPQGELYSGVHPKALVEGARVLQRAWEEKVAQPFIDRVLKIGDKYQKAREADPAVAEGLHLLDNAPTYLRAKAGQVVKDVIGNLSRAQERLFTLMADADSRENLRMNHPEEFAQAQNDPAIQDALRKYRPLERELTTLREKMGGQTLEQDYLRRVYDKYVAGVNKAEAPGTPERGTSAFDRVIRPQRTDKLSRESTSEYHYENGLHEFGPAFATKFIGTHLKALRDQVAREFLDKATALPTGAPEPRSIDYNGARYYRPDVAKDLRDAGAKGVKTYDRYDPTAGEKFPVPVDGKYLGPRELVKTLTDFGRREEGEPGALRRFFQEQILGFGFGVPHVANIMRRVSQSVPGGAVNPEGWARAWKVVLSKELRSRGISGLDDPTFDMLAKHGAISTGEVSNLRAYMGGNLNPANWARALAQVGHKFLFEPTAAHGFGGLDQRARLYIADLVQSQRPDLSEAKIAETVRNTLGDYNRANWTDQQKMLSKFMMFPGWDFSSVRWVLQHPIKTTVPPALMVLLANRTLNYFGQNRDEDRNDISNIHIGDRSYGTSLLRESVARNLFRPAIAFAQSKMRGESNQRALDAASRGMTAGAGGLLSMLRPDLSGFLALAANRQALFTGKEIVGPKDYDTPGKILPSKALEKQAVFAVRHAVPALDRMMESGEDVDLKSFAGGNLGVPNYREDAEKRLIRNAAEANRVFSNISRLAKTNPKQAMEMLKDPDNAAYALFHHDLNQMTTALRKIDQVRETVDASKIPDAEKQSRLKAIDNARQMFVDHADALNNLLFKRRSAGKGAASATSTGAPRNTIPLTLPSQRPGSVPFRPPGTVEATQ